MEFVASACLAIVLESESMNGRYLCFSSLSATERKERGQGRNHKGRRVVGKKLKLALLIKQLLDFIKIFTKIINCL